MSKIINSLRKRFTQIPNAIITDMSLSDGAHRVFSYMSTKPDDWQFNNRNIQNQLNIKRAETIAKYWKELIQSGWISRTPVLTESGKPSGYFDYILNFEPQIPTTQNAEVVLPTTDKPYTENQQIRKNRSYTNKEPISNKENNTPIPPKEINLGGVESWLEIAYSLNLTFSENEQSTISLWFEHLANLLKSKLSETQIKTNLLTLAKHKLDDFDICMVISDTISAGNYRWLIKPTATHKQNSISAKQVKAIKVIKPHRYGNLEYIIPETPTEKSQLAQYIQSCYKKRISPKNKSSLTSAEIQILDSHQKLFVSQAKNASGVFVQYASWLDYILQNEVYTGVSLLDQPIAAKPTVVDGTITQLATAKSI